VNRRHLELCRRDASAETVRRAGFTRVEIEPSSPAPARPIRFAASAPGA
jgi:hypothetical protein